MPLIAHTALPTFDLLRQQGREILTIDQALNQDLPELHIGFLNLMPDAAFKATERQFLHLVGSSNQNIHFYVHPCTIDGVVRDEQTLDYINSYYTSFDELKTSGLDALILTGTNPANPTLELEPFWEPLGEVIDWATENVTSMMCSCLAVHAIVKHKHNMERQPLQKKRWGVYRQQITNPNHPLLKDINSPFDVPHSRNNDISAEQLQAAGFEILVQGMESGVHMAVSPDLFRMVYLQGHPEYDKISLLKEYKREVIQYFEGARVTFPENPENYFNADITEIIHHHRVAVTRAKDIGYQIPAFPESEIESLLENTWRATGEALFDNWLGLVQQLTNTDRHLPFKAGIDPEDPLKIKQALRGQ
ncbi:MAG: homoserine O-succinyltransferase [FCB group bacterium]|nr:homoserine O-succinyltransferase [FCB group bacterium]MBL7027143.1 homoserine O-succinyltransferase [Candidatus Neomarinimicrobiota bacterium]MBL7120622.1 homoserine O-succinyltransferase [Candidatus Neomarinimicrobiota bacterium]